MRRNRDRDLETSMHRVEEKTIESEEKYKKLVENSKDSIVVIDLRGNVQFANKATEELTGYNMEEGLGMNVRKITPLRYWPKSLAMLLKAKKGEPIPYFESVVKRKDGKLVSVESGGQAIRKDGKVIGIQIITRDITERKKAERELQESEEKLRVIFENAKDAIFWADPETGLITNCNKAAESLLEKTKVEIVGKHQAMLHPPQKAKYYIDMFKRHAEQGRSIDDEAEIITRSGKIRSVHITASTTFIAGKPVIQGVFRDITERKILEERLPALNFYGGKLITANSLQQVYELTLDVMERTLGFEDATFMIVDKDCLKIASQRGYVKPIVLELPLDGSKKGITVKALVARKSIFVSDIRKERDYVAGVPGIRSELAVPVVTEEKVLGVLDVESKMSGAFDARDVVLLQILASHAATAIDNLEKRKEIERRSIQLASLMKNSTEIMHSTDLCQRLQTTAEAIQELGWRRVVISARNENLDIERPEDIVTAGLTDDERNYLWTNRQSGQVWRERFGLEYERFKIGEFYHLPWNDPWVRRKFSEGTVPSHLEHRKMVDWDPQDLLYAPLRLADGRAVGVISIDDPIDGKRPTKESLVPLELFLHQAAVAIENARLIQQLNAAKEQIKEYADQLEQKVQQRTQELVEAQNKLLKSERLAAIGEIAAMVGHDLRNPLTGIAGASYYLKMKLGSKADKKSREMLRLIEEDIEYSNKIINDLLEYSREMQLELTEVSPKTMMKETLSMIRIPKNIQVSDLTQTEPKIEVDVEKMKRVFVNIVKNAFDAMSKGGKLTIRTKSSNDCLRIVFIDTGTGMPEDVVEKLWTPLFTTKAKGMGLGLAICKRVVEAHRGNIFAESTVGRGTTFTVTIPIQPRLDGGEKIWVNMPESLLSTTTKA